ncbi:hypothetical protein AAFX60_008705 [Aliivibrio fischeri]|uniref:hypothetical protein n=1 Tax=Aliivibrio fischeri TaxID=668 RepID=UPI0007C5BB8C|nr:hypothetical protein [Aliivibrio fischeri]
MYEIMNKERNITFFKKLCIILLVGFSTIANASSDWKLDDNVNKEKITLPATKSSFLAFKLEMFHLLPSRDWELKDQENDWFTAQNHDCEIKVELSEMNTVLLSYRGEKKVPLIGNRNQYRSTPTCKSNWLGYLLKDMKTAQQIVQYTEEAIALSRASS